MFLKLVLLVLSFSGLQRDSQGLPRSGNTVRDDPVSRCGGDGPGISGNTLQNGDHCQNSHTGSQSRKPIPGTDTEGTQNSEAWMGVRYRILEGSFRQDDSTSD